MLDLRSFRPGPASRVVLLSGAGLSAASGVPTFRSNGGLWEGHRFEGLATPEAWERDPERVRQFYDWRRQRVLAAHPNPGHHALARLQVAWGSDRVALVTQNVDGLIQRAAAAEGCTVDVVEMHGSILRLRCEHDEHHPIHRTWEPSPAGEARADPAQDRGGRCSACGGALRPAVVWFGEVPHHLDRIAGLVGRSDVFLSIGTSGVVYPAAGLVSVARRAGARCIEINPEPTSQRFDACIAAGAEAALPDLVDAWLSK